MKFVVGLGNPGRKYVGTRHNVGFEVLLVLADRFAAGRWRTRFEAEVNEIEVSGERVLLVAPQTYMNLSGRSVQAIVNFHQADLSNLLLVCDDMNLPCGRLRLRPSGSAGGQKGLKNTIDQLGSQEFARLRIGVGRPPAGIDPANHVLQRFSQSEMKEMEQVVSRAASAVECWVSSGVETAMNTFNRADDEAASDKPDSTR